MASYNGKQLVTGIAAGGVLGAAIAMLVQRQRDRAAAGEMSTTSSGHSGDVYETQKAVAEYLLFHFCAGNVVLPYPPAMSPHAALDFASR